ncbi:MAG: glycosyltransferase family 4 protein [Ignavibacteria bacterium]|nr:glycosyltransferase family 4 protein [Ignavibacteria bacterium]
MNILFLTGGLNYADGVTSHLYNLICGLSENNELELHLLYSGGEAAEKFNLPSVRLTLNKNLRHKSRSIVNFSKAYFDIKKYCLKNDIDIVHSHNHYAANIAGRAAAKLKAGTVQTIHGLIPEGGRLRHFFADKYISLNNKITDHLILSNISKREDIFNIRQGIPEKNLFRKKLFQGSGSENIPVILYASRLIKEKGCDVFIKAAAEVRKNTGKELKFIIAGSGEYESELKSLSENLNAGIEFKGSVKDIFKVMRNADIFVSTTGMSSEGFPMTVAEAAFSGCLIISSRQSWLTEVFEEERDGLCYSVGDHIELAERIFQSLENKEESQRMAELYQDKATQIFSIGVMTEIHKKLYKECLTGK